MHFGTNTRVHARAYHTIWNKKWNNLCLNLQIDRA